MSIQTTVSRSDGIRSDRFLPACLLIAFATYLWSRLPLLTSPYAANEDASQHLTWLNDPKGFSPFDDTVGFIRDCLAPRGFYWVNRLAGLFLSPHDAVSLIDFLRCSLLFTLAYLIVLKMSGRSWIGLLLFYVLFHLSIIIGDVGMPRSFASVFLLTCFAAETGIGRRYSMWSFGILASSLFYPPCTLILCVAFLLVHVLKWIQTRRFPWPGNLNAALILVAVSVAALVSISASDGIRESPIGGPTVDRSSILKDPHYSEKGRVNLRIFVESPVPTYFKTSRNEFRNLLPVDSKAWTPLTRLLVVIGCFMVWAFVRRMHGADMALAVFLSGILLYFLAVALMFRLFTPNRYIQYTLLPSFMMLGAVLCKASEHLSAREEKLRGILVALILGFTALFLRPSGLTDFSSHSKLYEAVERHVKPGQMIATNNLKVGDMIPWFNGRSVYVNYENQGTAVFYKGQIRNLDRKMSVWNDIFNLQSVDSLAVLLEENHIDGLLLQAPYHGIADTFSILDPYPRTWKEYNALRLLIEARAPSAEFVSSGTNFRYYDLRGVDVRRVVSDSSGSVPLQVPARSLAGSSRILP
jgi:hypothetical protein